jgi:hypothetical protein
LKDTSSKSNRLRGFLSLCSSDAVQKNEVSQNYIEQQVLRIDASQYAARYAKDGNSKAAIRWVALERQLWAESDICLDLIGWQSCPARLPLAPNAAHAAFSQSNRSCPQTATTPVLTAGRFGSIAHTAGSET